MTTGGPLRATHLAFLAMSLTVVPAGLAYEGGPVTGGGAVGGTVRVVGDIVPLPPQRVYKHVADCGATVRDDRLVIDGAGMLQYAVVALHGIRKGKPLPTAPVVLHNRSCAFVPHVVSASAGQTLEIVNDDPFLHDAHAWLGQRTLFNLGIPRGRTVRRKLDEAGLVHVNCNVRHTWMHAYLAIADHPYQVVTAPDGRFAITDVPAGSYRLTVWHELLGTTERTVTVSQGGETSIDVTLAAVAPPLEPGPGGVEP